jgi:hypothetical protein
MTPEEKLINVLNVLNVVLLAFEPYDPRATRPASRGARACRRAAFTAAVSFRAVRVPPSAISSSQYPADRPGTISDHARNVSQHPAPGRAPAPGPRSAARDFQAVLATLIRDDHHRRAPDRQDPDTDPAQRHAFDLLSAPIPITLEQGIGKSTQSH